ncbi:hypothetical protein [Methylorubrum populi]|uniref:Uncharacterized protein n=1 Tax=Methylorubrum populi TaxID=223967 RepID=A0A833J9Y1_9HYPH|nr:hypothetical protein [Methylorubrum populi]KAB7788000.1 hypothetical protein F8B43_0005 [Methylorubrum populi]
MTGLTLEASGVAFYDLRTAVAMLSDEASRRINSRLTMGAHWSGNTAKFVISEEDARTLLDSLPANPSTRAILAQLAEMLSLRDAHKHRHEAGIRWQQQMAEA